MSNTQDRPVFLTFGLHAHQPAGNFDHVFRDHLQDVYHPFLTRVAEAGFMPLTLHLSGPLLDWLEANAPEYLDLVGRLASEGKLELLLAGYYEPILPSLCREDRLDQIGWMREALRSRFGVDATGCWLTERVWEPDLAADLVDAGVKYVLVDDRHFVAAGFSREELHQPFRTEAHGKSLAVFPIDETLRYLIPFHSPADTVAYLRELRTSGRYLAVAADDIEKFGGWPGTRKWVYEDGWMDGFTAAMAEMRENGEIRIATFSQALDELDSGGLAYLPSASYREMEEWSLPPAAFQRLDNLKEKLGEEAFSRGDSPLIRGSHWRNFLVKYPESNRMHKKTLALSTLCRERGDPEGARRALGEAQCNDVYWHGVFGGLYLRHLRDHVWRKMAEAEGLLRVDDDLAWERLDLDLDGQEELWIHSHSFSALVSWERGAGIEELTLFGPRVNLANTLTRRREAYHGVGEGKGRAEDETSGTPSIHDLEGELSFTELPPVDQDDRAIFLERILAEDTTVEGLRSGGFEPVHSWARTRFELTAVETGPGHVGFAEGGDPPWIEVSLTSEGPASLTKRLRFETDGAVECVFEWNAEAFPTGAWFSTELSLGSEAAVSAEPEAQVLRFPISTYSKSERGLDETVQGESVTVMWPVSQGSGRVYLTRL